MPGYKVPGVLWYAYYNFNASNPNLIICVNLLDLQVKINNIRLNVQIFMSG